MERQKDRIEQAPGFPLFWPSIEANAQCRMHIRKDAGIQDETLWSKQSEWLGGRLERMYKVFKPHVMDLKTGAEEDGGEGV